MTFGAFWPEFISMKEVQVKKTSLYYYHATWKADLQGYFGDLEIESSRSRDFQDFANRILLSGVKIKTARNKLMLIKNMRSTYSLMYEVPLAPIKIMWPTENKSAETAAPETFTEKEIETMLHACRQDPSPINLTIAIAICTGMRIGEACGVRYSDFNFKEKVVAVKRTVGRVESPTGKSERYVQSPKCKSSIRECPIPDVLNAVFKSLANVYPPDAYISSNNSEVFNEPRVFREQYKRFLNRLGIPYRHPHVMRHTYATMLLQAGTDVRTTASLLGHADATTTLNVYCHTTIEAKRRAANRVFGGKKGFLK